MGHKEMDFAWLTIKLFGVFQRSYSFVMLLGVHKLHPIQDIAISSWSQCKEWSLCRLGLHLWRWRQSHLGMLDLAGHSFLPFIETWFNCLQWIVPSALVQRKHIRICALSARMMMMMILLLMVVEKMILLMKMLENE